MEWVKFTETRPNITDTYFVKGKKGLKACIYYYHEEQYWELEDLPLNYFNDEEIYWLDESVD
jgi:hypothetical protein